MTADSRTVRERVLDRVKRRLSHRSSPRFEMALIVGGTGAGGFLASAGLLFLGVRSMAVRYAMAVGIAYLVFLFLVWVWLHSRRGTLDVSPDVNPVDLVEVTPDLVPDSPLASADAGDSSVGGLDIGGGDELVLVLAALAAILAALAAAGYVVATAPAFFAEVLLDGALSYGLYRRLRGLDRRHWLETALSRTAVPFAIAVLFFSIAGVVMQGYVPDGDSIGDVWNHFSGGV